MSKNPPRELPFIATWTPPKCRNGHVQLPPNIVVKAGPHGPLVACRLCGEDRPTHYQGGRRAYR